MASGRQTATLEVWGGAGGVIRHQPPAKTKTSRLVRRHFNAHICSSANFQTSGREISRGEIFFSSPRIFFQTRLDRDSLTSLMKNVQSRGDRLNRSLKRSPCDWFFNCLLTGCTQRRIFCHMSSDLRLINFGCRLGCNWNLARSDCMTVVLGLMVFRCLAQLLKQYRSVNDLLTYFANCWAVTRSCWSSLDHAALLCASFTRQC